ncbi:MAG TPA: biotin-dependent carboxyltransferase family protein [Fimbriimonadaceae bacterium]|nr:biotin-dependent carboxyltransferase family protein [Fimbriimonadaceae bacterium]
MSLRVLRMAAGATFQDLGRPGFRRFGVPLGGAFDQESHRLALALVGAADGPTLEIPIPGAEFEAVADDRMAVVGAVVPIVLDGTSLLSQSSFRVHPGQRLSIGPADQGLRVYLASARGWRVKRRLESASGVVPDSELASGLELPTREGLVRLAAPPSSLDRGPVRLLPGPQATIDDLQALSHGVFQVGLNSNRVGIRLQGGDFAPRGELTSEPSVFGAVQLAPSGELLVHGPDGPTIGGYPKVAVVAMADLDRLGQLRPGMEVRFEMIDPHRAQELRTAREERLATTFRDLKLSLA